MVPHDEMRNQVLESIARIMGQSNGSTEYDELGFFDHQVAMQEEFDKLGQIITNIGDDTRTITVELTKFADQMTRAQGMDSQGTQAYLQKAARRWVTGPGPKQREAASPIVLKRSVEETNCHRHDAEAR